MRRVIGATTMTAVNVDKPTYAGNLDSPLSVEGRFDEAYEVLEQLDGVSRELACEGGRSKTPHA